MIVGHTFTTRLAISARKRLVGRWADPYSTSRSSATPQVYRAPAALLGHPKTCQWIEGEPKPTDDCKCGLATVPNKPYCSEHTARAYVQGKPDADPE